MAVLDLALAALILGWVWWMVTRHPPVMAARGRDTGEEEPVELAKAPSSNPWFGPPDNPVLELKAARIRAEPIAAPAPDSRIGRRAGWTAEDDAALLRLLGEDLPAAEIATKLGRSEKSVQLRIPLLRLRQRQS